MTFPEIVKTTLWDIIDEMSHSLSSFVKNPDKDFLRKRKLDFKKMMHLIISMESGSLNHELLKFFEYDSSVPTNSAFYQQRSKCIFRKNCASVPEERSAIPLQTEQSSASLLVAIIYSTIPARKFKTICLGCHSA